MKPQNSGFRAITRANVSVVAAELAAALSGEPLDVTYNCAGQPSRVGYFDKTLGGDAQDWYGRAFIRLPLVDLVVPVIELDAGQPEYLMGDGVVVVRWLDLTQPGSRRGCSLTARIMWPCQISRWFEKVDSLTDATVDVVAGSIYRLARGSRGRLVVSVAGNARANGGKPRLSLASRRAYLADPLLDGTVMWTSAGCGERRLYVTLDSSDGPLTLVHAVRDQPEGVRLGLCSVTLEALDELGERTITTYLSV